MYDIEAARAERETSRTDKAFEFTLDGRVWRMRRPGDLPAVFVTWGIEDYFAHVDTIIEATDDSGDVFPVEAITAADFGSLVTAWLGSTPGE